MIAGFNKGFVLSKGIATMAAALMMRGFFVYIVGYGIVIALDFTFLVVGVGALGNAVCG